MNRTKDDSSWTTAMTFAEAGEWDIARTFIPASRRNRLAAWLEKMFTAVALAEEGLHEDALRVADLGPLAIAPRPANFLELCGLGNIRCTFGSCAPTVIGVAT